ncbi:TSUP family transporter [[Clostridium] colinum]|uniref:TSUP family transporter n=1 Tax=[Clostridium] colinum TaxID=36835 RepID=UPI0020243DA2
MLVPSLEKFLKMEEHKAHSTAIAIVLPLSIVSIFIYCKGVNIDIKSVVIISLGGLLGGLLGAKYLKKIPSNWLHKIFGLFMLIGAWRLIL